MFENKSSQKIYAEVVFPLPLNHAFTYLIPHHLQPLICPGYRVLAPFGKRRLTGYVVALKAHCEITELKEIEDILDSQPVLSAEMLRLTQWISEYYMASWGEVIDAALPGGINLESKRQVHLAEHLDRNTILAIADINTNQRELLLLLHRKKHLLVSQMEIFMGITNLNYNLSVLEKKGLIQISRKLIEPKVKIKYANYVTLPDKFKDASILTSTIAELMKNHSRQAEILIELGAAGEGYLQADLLRRTGVSIGTLKKAQEKDLVLITKKELFRDYYSGIDLQPVEKIHNNPDQVAVLTELEKQLEDKRFKPFLLYGVTGSGKTQVYVEILHKVRKQDRTAIVLVPEIALTPQTVSRFKNHFGEDVAVLHSRMSNGERYDSWRKIKNGDVHIVIGPRSAIFAPLQRIGLIVVDEEHESSYKQNDASPRYHARDVALMRGKINQAIVILGSATPSVESYYNTQIRKYQLLSLPKRVQNLPLPQIEIVDMREEWKQHKGKPSPIFSHRLMDKIAEKLTSQEQIILLQNRRGFSTFILCKDCGHVEKCVNCNITLTYHLFDHRLRCHYCDFEKQAPTTCPACGSYQVTFKGTGTQKVEEEIKTHFPGARLVRMDLDTTKRKGAHDRILRDFRDFRYDILLGTQMVAKGLDFPKVTLVGVISADTTLQLPDFRASERTFQLLTQVAGRSGRKTKQGEVVIQTYSPQNHSILFAKKHDYLRFFAKEINERKELSYPPLGRLIAIEFRGLDESKVQQTASDFAKAMPAKDFYYLLGPAPAPLSKLKNEHRYHLIIKYDKQLDPQGKAVRSVIQSVQQLPDFKRKTGIKLSVDVDPTDLF